MPKISEVSRRRPLTFGSLFAGIGGIDLGLERVGMTCRWQVEIDEFCRRVLARHWPSVSRWDDVRTFPPPDSDPGDWRVDLIAGGFPCHDISSAGGRAGIDGPRSGLWAQFSRVLRVLRPRYVLVENVSSLLDRRGGLDRVLGNLASLGYDAEWHCIPAAAVGAPHIRDRAFVLGYPDLSQAHSHAAAGASRDAVGQPGGRPVPLAGRRLRPPRGPWPAEPGVGRVADGVPGRVVERHLTALGNAVVPAVAETVGRLLLEIIDAEGE